jgi:hypothetical protein
MQTIRTLESALIDLEYAAADYSYWKASTSDPLELAEMKAPKIRAARLMVRFALDSMQTPSDREISRAA